MGVWCARRRRGLARRGPSGARRGPPCPSTFDQAGIFVRVSAQRWVKAGVEFADGCPSVGAVVTDWRSDWSLAPTPNWGGHRVLLRVSRSGDALTFRDRSEGSRSNLSALPRSSRTSLPRRTVHLRPDPSRADCPIFMRGARLSPTPACTSDRFTGSARSTAPSETPWRPGWLSRSGCCNLCRRQAATLTLRRGPVSSPTSVGTGRISHLRSEIYANVARPPGPSWRIPCCAVCC